MSLVQIPVELTSLIQVGVEMAIVFLLTQLAKAGFDFSGYKAQLVAAVMSAIVVFINALLAKVPVSYEAIATAVLQLIVVLLGAFGVYKLYRQAKPKAAG